MAESQTGIAGIDLRGNNYTVEQAFIRNKYVAYDENGEEIIRAKQKMFKLKEEFPFVDSSGEEVFRVKAGGIMDVAGNYAIIDAQTEETVAILDNDYSIFQDTWKVRDGQTEAKRAEINSRGALVTMARNVIPFGEIIPHKYEISDQQDNHVGSIDGQISLRDRYEITIDDAESVPKEPVIAAAMVIDAIQGN